MSNESGSPTTQFSLRVMLSCTTVLCVMLGLAAPFIRAQSEELARRLIWICGLTVAIGVVAVLLLCWRRRNIELGGAFLFRTRHPRAWMQYLPAAMMLSLFLVLTIGVGFMMYPMLRDMPTAPGMGLDPLLTLSAVGALAPGVVGLAYAAVLVWWGLSPLSMEVRTHGVGVGATTFLPFGAIRSVQWLEGPYGPVLTIHAYAKRYIVVMDNDMQDSVGRLFSEHGIEQE